MNQNCYKDRPHTTMIFFKTNDFILLHSRPSSGHRDPEDIQVVRWRPTSPDRWVQDLNFKSSSQNFIRRKHGHRPGHETGRGRTSSKNENNFLILQIKNELIIQKARHKLFQKSGLHRTRTLLPDEVIMEFVLNRTLELIPSKSGSNLNLWNFQKTWVHHSIDMMQSNLQSFVRDLLNLFHQMNLPFQVYYVIILTFSVEYFNEKYILDLQTVVKNYTSRHLA